jgi:hypothetical protein
VEGGWQGRLHATQPCPPQPQKNAPNIREYRPQ